MTLNSEALLPCPLCNCGMMLDRFVDWEGQPLANQVIIHPSPSECPLVDTQIDATPEAIAAWNRRSPSLSGGEVVAWRVRERPGFDWRFVDGDPGRDPRLNGYEKQPLYASPAPLEGVTDELVERAFKDGLAYGSNVEGADPETAWMQSRVRASLTKDQSNG